MEKGALEIFEKRLAELEEKLHILTVWGMGEKNLDEMREFMERKGLQLTQANPEK